MAPFSHGSENRPRSQIEKTFSAIFAISAVSSSSSYSAERGQRPTLNARLAGMTSAAQAVSAKSTAPYVSGHGEMSNSIRASPD
jgi:hypothetical protein